MGMRTLGPGEIAELIQELRRTLEGGPGGRAGAAARCRADLSHTEAILRRLGKTPGEIPWILAELRDQGRSCDCEVIANVGPDGEEGEWEDEPPDAARASSGG
jgi:hypothetical protein